MNQSDYIYILLSDPLVTNELVERKQNDNFVNVSSVVSLCGYFLVD